VTVYEPALVFAVAVTDAKPSAFVCADAADKFALGSSLPGAVKFTVTPDTGFPSLSVTNAFNGSPNAVVTKVVCPEPLLIAIVAAAPGVLVKPKSAVPVKPLPVAVTVYEPALVFAVAFTDAKPSARS